MDHLSKEQRTALMKRVKQAGSNEEMLVRRGLHARGLRYVVVDRRLPGTPDLSFPKYKAVVFVHGCFWHGHACSRGRGSRSNVEYWQPKIEANKVRDNATEAQLTELGWRVFVIWGCQLRSDVRRKEALDELAKKIRGSEAT